MNETSQKSHGTFEHVAEFSVSKLKVHRHFWRVFILFYYWVGTLIASWPKQYDVDSGVKCLKVPHYGRVAEGTSFTTPSYIQNISNPIVKQLIPD